MRNSYRTKKAILLTCKRFREVGWELMFRCLYFNSPARLLDMCVLLESSLAEATTVTSSLGWWTRRLQVSRYSTREFEEQNITNDDVRNAFVTIISHCPNLEVFHVDWPMKEAFGPVADALKMFSRKNLRSVTWVVPSSALNKVVFALDALRGVVNAHIEFEASSSNGDEDRVPKLGAAGGLQLNLGIRQLSVRGYAQAFLEQACEWSMPSLKTFIIDSGMNKTEDPDLASFLKHHGDGLEFLDLNTGFRLPIAQLLDFCPQLTALAFNGDWRISPSDEVQSKLVNQPLLNVTTVGLHGLTHAFGVGVTAAATSLAQARIIQRSNDLNMAALNKMNFPNLQRIRALDGSMLRDLNTAGQPSLELGGMARWERWWDRCWAAGIRLEDCTGESLGTLPDIDDLTNSPEYIYDPFDGLVGESDSSDDSEDDEDDSSEDEEDDSDGSEGSDDSDDSEYEAPWKNLLPPVEDNTPGRTQELRRLLAECQAMSAKRSEEPSPLLALMTGGGPMSASSSTGAASMAEMAFQMHYGPPKEKPILGFGIDDRMPHGRWLKSGRHYG